MSFQEFLARPAARARYWRRSAAGWRRMAAARPNAAHRALATLEAAGRVEILVTQNVDGLHRRAGSAAVVDLHGRLDAVDCLGCRISYRRELLQAELERLNPGAGRVRASLAPDGDAEVAEGETGFRVPACPACGGILKPAVVFFGESVPPRRVERAFVGLARADALLVVGSSLMVWSGFRFVRRAVERGLPVAIVNLGRTRADDAATLKLEAPCGATLVAAVARLPAVSAGPSPAAVADASGRAPLRPRASMKAGDGGV